MRYKQKISEKDKAEKEKSFEKLLKSVRTIQNHWRGYAMRKVYKDLKLDKATKTMQLDYFCQQVLFLADSFKIKINLL